jgi:hypothetical protein
MQELNEEYSDDPEEIGTTGIKARTKVLTLLTLGVFAILGTTFASNINLNSGQKIEFGQGLTQATSCDSQVKFKPVSSFTDRLWTEVGGNDIFQDGFIVSDFVVSDIANSCQGKQFIINAYGDTSSTPLNAFPLIVNYVPDFGGFFTYEVNSPNTIQAFLPQITVDTTTAGEGTRGATSEKGASFFEMGEWAGLYSNPGQVDARLVKKYTIQTQNIPTNSLALTSGNYSVTSGRTLDNRMIWVKGLYVKTLGHADDISPNSTQTGVALRQPFWIYVPTDDTRGVTKTAYTFTGSLNITCADVYANGDAGWIYECTPSENNWSLNINYSGI